MSDSASFASFLHVRDPSILAWNRPPINPSIKMNLCSRYSEDISLEKKVEHLQVYLRIKPSKDLLDLYEISSDKLICRVPTALRNTQNGKKVKRKYTFSKIYGPDTSQTQIFNDCIKEKVLNFINGKSCTIFTYGISGSGKTYTILGTAHNPGLIPRSLEYLFRSLPNIDAMPHVKPTTSDEVISLTDINYSSECNRKKYLLNNSMTYADKSLHSKTYKTMQQRLSTEPSAILDPSSDVTVGIWVSFVEVYNENIYDLLQMEPVRGKQRVKLRLGQDSKSNAYVKNLTSISVASGLEAYEILQYGMHNLNYAATSVNDHSSRSHCIFTIKLVQCSSRTPDVQISHFNFCDLAGSERLKKTGNVGDRLKETNNINTSLHVLGRCISSIRESQKSNNESRIIPFRDSKLTMLFQSALSGQESIAMVVNMNATKAMFDESQRVLNFSAIAKDITMEVDTKPKTTKRRFSQYVHSQNQMPNISEATTSEIDPWEQINTLTLNLEHERQMSTEREQQIRNEVAQLWRTRYNDADAKWNVRLNDQEKHLRQIYEKKMENLEHYDKLNSKRARITILDSDEEDSNIQHEEYVALKLLYNESQSQISKLQAEVTRLNFASKNDSDQLKSVINVQNTKLRAAEQALLVQKSLVADATNEYKELEYQLEERTCEMFALQKDLMDLTDEISALREENAKRAADELANGETSHEDYKNCDTLQNGLSDEVAQLLEQKCTDDLNIEGKSQTETRKAIHLQKEVIENELEEKRTDDLNNEETLQIETDEAFHMQKEEIEKELEEKQTDDLYYKASLKAEICEELHQQKEEMPALRDERKLQEKRKDDLYYKESLQAKICEELHQQKEEMPALRDERKLQEKRKDDLYYKESLQAEIYEFHQQKEEMSALRDEIEKELEKM